MSNNWPLQKNARSFYGNPAEPDWFASNVVKVVPPYPLTYAGKPVKAVSIHKKCADSLRRVFDAISSAYVRQYGAKMLEHMIADGVTIYDGSYNYRPIAGSSNLSMHAYACALDFDAARNGFTYDRAKGNFKTASIIVQAFKAEGWRWGGDYVNRRDPMHFEAVR